MNDENLDRLKKTKKGKRKEMKNHLHRGKSVRSFCNYNLVIYVWVEL